MTFQDLISQIRTLCKDLPEAEEYLMHSHPSFRAGKKCFVILGEGDSGLSRTGVTMSIKVSLMEQGLFLEDPRFSRTHYIGQHGWVTLHVDRGTSPEEVEHLVLKSYRGAATKRALKALDARVLV
jgi:predicted DNA-binding protein (MmcQ/YjbR family)